ncbi:putative acid phosphatase 1-like [Capsicum annuum]|nr:putative acid phosphatase 1-like [Capsicum annuum]
MTLQNTGWLQINGLHLDNILAKGLQIAYYLIEEQMEKKSSPDGHIFFVRLFGDPRYCGIWSHHTLNVSKDGKDLWVFYVDEATLSNVPYYARPTVGFGATNANIGKKFESWINEGKSPAVSGVLRLYQTLLDLDSNEAFVLSHCCDHFAYAFLIISFAANLLRFEELPWGFRRDYITPF